MPLSGMTGFARAEGDAHGLSWSWEARSVNNKGLDIRLRVPAGSDRLEVKAREIIQARFARGSISATLHLKRVAGEEALRADLGRASAYAAAARALVRRRLASPPTAEGLLALRGVIEAAPASEDETTRDLVDAAVLATLAEAAEDLSRARRAEGDALSPVLSGLIDQIAAHREAAEASAATQPALVKERLEARLAELVDNQIDPQRLAAEVALLAAKADVREELDRLGAHIDAARGHLQSGEPVGRKLDFLSQEFMREANTLCSKSADTALTRIGLDLKASIEQFREQVQNVE